MKVYFEETGRDREFVWITVYIKPQEDGSAFMYDYDGKLFDFSYVEPHKAFCIDSKELPEDLWYSLCHGSMDEIYTYKEFEGYKWEISDLCYMKMAKRKSSKNATHSMGTE